MDILNTIFEQYDKIIANLPIAMQAGISVLLLLLLIWQIFMIVKSGHWIFIAALIIFLPGTWPATKFIGNLLLMIIKFLLVRAQLILFNI